MIEKISGKNFKGLTFDQPLKQNNLFVGPVGAGKSGRTEALMLAIKGYIPGAAKKTAGSISDSYCPAGHEAFTVGFTVKGMTFANQFIKNPGGSITRDYLLNNSSKKKSEYEKAIGVVGNPGVFDLSIFFGLSDRKKIDYLLDLFPPGDEFDINGLIDEVKKLSTRRNSVVAEGKEKNATIKTLLADASGIELPAGSLEEIRADIGRAEAELNLANTNLNKAIRAEQKKKDAKKRAEQKEKDEEELAAKKVKMEEENKAELAKKEAELKEKVEKEATQNLADPTTTQATADTTPGTTVELVPPVFSYPVDPDDINSLIEAFDAVNCGVCAIKIRLIALRAKWDKMAKNAIPVISKAILEPGEEADKADKADMKF